MGGVKANLIIFLPWGEGFKTNLNRKVVGGGKQINFFFVYNLRSKYFFLMGG